MSEQEYSEKLDSKVNELLKIVDNSTHSECIFILNTAIREVEQHQRNMQKNLFFKI